METNIRRMLKADKAALLAILQNTVEFDAAEVAVAEEVIDSYLSTPAIPDYYVLVAETDGKITGYICYGPTPMTDNTWDIYWLAVAPEKRGKGIGGRLVKLAEAFIAKAKGRMVILETSGTAAYQNTVRFYHKQGYETIARIPDFYKAGDDKLILWKKLN